MKSLIGKSNIPPGCPLTRNIARPQCPMHGNEHGISHFPALLPMLTSTVNSALLMKG